MMVTEIHYDRPDEAHNGLSDILFYQLLPLKASPFNREEESGDPCRDR
jgi:hypothetical protein